jgi:hypothetical protein
MSETVTRVMVEGTNRELSTDEFNETLDAQGLSHTQVIDWTRDWSLYTVNFRYE